jgi:ATP-dependent helicase/DNAse subunit B
MPGGVALSPVDQALRTHHVAVERLQQLAGIEGRRKPYFLGYSRTDCGDMAAFGDLGPHLDLHGRLLDPQQPWSPTMLEDLAACPFAFFAAHILGLTPRAEPDYDVSPAVLGQVAHDILAQYFHTEPPADVGAAVQRMRTIAGRVLVGRAHGPGYGHPGFWQVRQAELLAILDDLAVYLATQHPAAYRTRYHEQTMTGMAPGGARSMALTGRVDRVAVHDGPGGITSILVQDFKYSGSAARYRQRLQLDALGHSSFQLPVYLYLTLQQLARDGHQVAAAAELRLEYLLVKDAGKKAWDVTIGPDFFNPDQAGSLFHGMQRLTEGAIAGRFAPHPLDPKQTCAYCTYTTLCRFWSSGAGAEAGRLHDTTSAGSTVAAAET